MYKNRISRPTPNRNPQFFIRRSDIVYDDRAAYVEFVCAIWNEGRFGPGCVPSVVIDLSARPEPEPTAFYDLPNDEPYGEVLRDALLLQGRAGCEKLEAAFRTAKQMHLFDTSPNANNITVESASHQGRGSP